MIRDLETILNQATGRVDLEPTDLFLLDGIVNLRARDVELYTHGATIEYRDPQKKQSAPIFACVEVSGIIDDPVIVGQKDPDAKGTVARSGHAGFFLRGCTDLTLRGPHVSHVAGDFVTLAALRTGTQKRGLTFKPCRRIVLDAFVGLDAGRHRIAAIGVGYADGTVVPRGGGAPGVTDRGSKPGLIVKANCLFRGWGSAKTDLELWQGYKTPAGAVLDESTSTKKAT